MDARQVALLTLNACQRQGGWSDGVLKKQLAIAELDARDAALATRLCFGVLQNESLLDFYLSQFSNIPLKRMESRVLCALRLGAYQLLFMDKIPQSAAVDQSVVLARANAKNPRVAGMVNGILRSLTRNLENLPAIPRNSAAEYLSIRYSHPRWLVEEWVQRLGEEGAAKLMEANNGQPPMVAMVNRVKTTTEGLISALEGQGVTAQPHPWLEHCLILSGTGNIEELDAFRLGLFYIQDPASRLAIAAAGIAPGMRVLDMCAAPGGKSFAAAIAMENRGEIISCDLHPHKKKLIQNGADRLGLNVIEPRTADGKVLQESWRQSFDVVLVDAPCSGLGVIRKKPDIRYKNPDELAGLPAVQRALLENAACYVRPGGVLLYSTCTVLKRENEDIAEDFLSNHPEFQHEDFLLPGPVGAVTGGMVTLWPHSHETDGFFIAKLRKGEQGHD